jgi:hypothetical protein
MYPELNVKFSMGTTAAIKVSGLSGEPVVQKDTQILRKIGQ